MKNSTRRELLRIAEGRPALARTRVHEDADNAHEKTYLGVVTELVADTAAYRKKLNSALAKADGLNGKLPGMEDSIDHMVGSLEMSDKMLEDLIDAVLGDAKPYYKKNGLQAPRHT